MKRFLLALLPLLVPGAAYAVAPDNAGPAHAVHLDINAPAYPRNNTDWFPNVLHVDPFKTYPRVAWAHGVGAAGVNCGLFTYDNGCTTRAVGIDTGHAPAWQDTDLVCDSAWGGQLPARTDPNYTTKCNARITSFHHFNSAIPGYDFPIGSESPTTLPAISSVGNGGTVDNLGICKYWAYNGVGAPTNPAPVYNGVQPGFIYCRYTAEHQHAIIKNFDFSNEGGGTGTAWVGIWIAAAAGTYVDTYLDIKNVYLKCGETTAWCPYVGTNGNMDLVNWINSAQTSPTSISFINVTFDANVFALINKNYVGTGWSGAALAQFMNDTRNDYYPTYIAGDSTIASMYQTHFQNVVFARSGHDPVVGSPPGHYLFETMVVYAPCLSGFFGCHGEIAEIVQGKQFRHHTVQEYKNGIVWVNASWNAKCGQPQVTCQGQIDHGGDDRYAPSGELTAPNYVGSGGPNGVIVDSYVGQDEFFFINPAQCTNAPTTDPTYPYGPDNPCSGGSGGWATMAFGWAPYVWSTEIHRILFDDTGVQSCYAPGNPQPIGNAGGELAPIGFNGTTMTKLAPDPGNPAESASTGVGTLFIEGYGLGVIYPGQGIVDNSGTHVGFVNTYIKANHDFLGSNAGTYIWNADITVDIGNNGITSTRGQTLHLQVGQPLFPITSEPNGTNAIGGANGRYVASGCPGACLPMGTQITVNGTGTPIVQLVTTSGGSTLIGTCCNATAQLNRTYNDGGYVTATGTYVTTGITFPFNVQATVGDPVFIFGGTSPLGYIANNCPGACDPVGTVINPTSGTTIQLTLAKGGSTLVTLTPGSGKGLQYYNSGGTIQPLAGSTPMNGTYILNDSEPNIPAVMTADFAVATHMDTLTVVANESYDISYNTSTHTANALAAISWAGLNTGDPGLHNGSCL